MNSKLFTSYPLKHLTLKNRVVMAPMTRSRATADHVPTPLMAEYYGQRAGAGLIITEGVSPSPNGLGYARIPGVFSDEQEQAWRPVANAIHAKGSAVFMQLMHTGRVSARENMPSGAQVVSSTDRGLPGETFADDKGMVPYTPPRQMTREDIDHAVSEYVLAAERAVGAGFDGVELHAANGYLIEQFINANLNNRADEYGGSIENRVRFLLEITEAVAAAIGADRIGVRVSPNGFFNMNEGAAYPNLEATYEYIAIRLSELGVAYIHVVDHESMGAPAVPVSVKEKIRTSFKGTYILSGGYDRERAETDLDLDKGDLVAFGRPFISNPDLVERLQGDLELAQADVSTFYTPGEKGYTDYQSVQEA